MQNGQLVGVGVEALDVDEGLLLELSLEVLLESPFKFPFGESAGCLDPEPLLPELLPELSSSF